MSARVEAKTFYPQRPEYSSLSKEINISPSQLIYYFQNKPLDKYFIDWVADNDYQIRYRLGMKNAEGYTLFPPREILIKAGMSKEKTDFAIMHELVHVAVPFAHGYFGIGMSKAVENAIDEIALPYSTNEEFMDYVKRKIPSFSDFKPGKFKFPDWAISGDRPDWIVNPARISFI